MAQIHQRIYQCDQCLKVNALKLDCQHQRCLDCLKIFIKEKSTEKNIENFFCPSCFEVIPAEISEVFLIGKKEFQDYLKELKRCEFCKTQQNQLIVDTNKQLICLYCLQKPDNPPNQGKPEQPLNPIHSKPVQVKSLPKPSLKPKTPCFICKSQPGVNESCLHNYCLSCLKKLSQTSICKDPFSSVKCDQCGVLISQAQVSLCFGSEAKFNEFQEKCVNDLFFAAKFDCGVCMNNFRIEEGITFDCDHRFCMNCVKEYFREKIMSSNVSEDELVCPSCGVAINHNVIQGIDRELYDKYVTFAFRNWRPEEGAVLKYCCFCDAAAEIAENAKRFRCPKCNKAYCPQCNKDHLEKVTCDEFVKLEEREKERNEREKEENERKNQERLKRLQENQRKNEEDEKKRKNQEKVEAGKNFNEGLMNGNKGQGFNLIDDDANRKEQKRLKDEEKKRKDEEKKRKDEEKKRKDEEKKRKDEEKKRKDDGKRQQEENKKKEKEAKINAENNFLNAIKDQSKKCPKCKNFVLKDSGCNFIKCRWPGCKDSYFCYLCSNPLKSTQHYSHYKSSGPFGKTCNKLDGIKDEV